MCVIIVKPDGKKMPDRETLNRCWTRNNDGAGLMYIDQDKKVQIRKGYMSFQALTSAIKALPEPIKNGMMVIHMRIKTHGKIDAACTHPFPLTDDYRIMGQRRCECEIGIAHNGILSLDAENDNVSDTMTFVKKVLMKHPEIMTNPDETKDDDTLFNMAIGTNKFVFMLGALNLVRMVGEFSEDKETGCYYSNDCWKKSEYAAAGGSFLGGHRYNGYGGYSDYDDDPSFLQGTKPVVTAGGRDTDHYKNYTGSGSVVARAPNAPKCTECADVSSAMSKWPCSVCSTLPSRPYFFSEEDKRSGKSRDYAKMAELMRDREKELELIMAKK